MVPTGQTLAAPEELYLRLRQVVADMPDLRVELVSPELSRWLAEASFSSGRPAT